MNFIKKHLFSILCTLYFYVIILYRSPGLTTLAWGSFNILSLLLIVNIFAKTKYTLIWTVLLGLILSFDAFFRLPIPKVFPLGHLPPSWKLTAPKRQAFWAMCTSKPLSSSE